MKVSPQYTRTSGSLGSSTPKQANVPPAQSSLKPMPRRSSSSNLLLDMPIGWRLALGFVIAALAAALAAGAVGLQREQSLTRQTNFYQNLLQLNTSLTTGHSFLELMGSKLQQTLDDASAPTPSHETIQSDVQAISNLTTLYTQTLGDYANNDLLSSHPDQLSLLAEANASNLASEQTTLTSSAQRTWSVYQSTQQQILADITTSGTGGLTAAELLLQEQGQPTNADALSALQSLIQLNARVAQAVNDATNVEIQNQLWTTVLATAGAFLLIVLVGWFISDTLVRRLRHLHRVTRAVEEGRTNERVLVAGRDEIAEVSLAVNAMIDTITGLLDETRQQRDALTGAAEHLFSDMRIVNAGDLRVSAAVSSNNDPIGMLANAFNFTVGRFRRFILRTQTTIEQLDVISRQGLERSNAFISLARTQLRDTSAQHGQPSTSPLSTKTQTATPATNPLRSGTRKPVQTGMTNDATSTLSQQIPQIQDALLHNMRDDLQKRLGTSRETLEFANLSLGRLNELISARPGGYAGTVIDKATQAQLQELTALEKHLRKLSWEVQQAQFNMNSNLTRIDAAFVRFSHTLAELPMASGGLSEAADGGGYLNDAQFQEFVRQAGSFAVDVNTLSKRLAGIVQEMRSGIGPFRLEGLANMGEFSRSVSTQGAGEQPFPANVPSGHLI